MKPKWRLVTGMVLGFVFAGILAPPVGHMTIAFNVGGALCGLAIGMVFDILASRH